MIHILLVSKPINYQLKNQVLIVLNYFEKLLAETAIKYGMTLIMICAMVHNIF